MLEPHKKGENARDSSGLANSFGSVLRPDAILCPPSPTHNEIASMMSTLWRLNTRPGSFPEVASRHLSGIVEAWVDCVDLKAAWCSSDKIIFKIPSASRDNWGHFCIFDPAAPLKSTFGYLTDREVNVEWPKDWQNYGRFREKNILDHCCGEGARVAYLAEQGFRIYGCDATAFDSKDPRVFFSFGALPFRDNSFGLVESRFGVFFISQRDLVTCRLQFDELIRVTEPGGEIRVQPIEERLLAHLLSSASKQVILNEIKGGAASLIKI